MILSVRFAARELRSGVKGFRIFLACLALGVAALAAAGSTAEAFRQGLAAQSRTLLGGDLAISIEGRRFSAKERSVFSGLGRTADAVHLDAMASGPQGRRLADVRGVSPAYPLAGSVKLIGAADLGAAFVRRDGLEGAAVGAELADRLGLKLGDRIVLGDSPFRIAAFITDEPDRLGRGFALGPPVLMSLSALDASGLLTPDALFGETIRVALRSGARPAAAARRLERLFPANGLRVRTRNDAAAGLGRLIDQLEFFLSFIGLAALLAGGLGVSSAVAAYLEGRRRSIAVLKALGGEASLVRNIYLLQIAALTGLGVAIGLVVGAAAPFALGALYQNRLPVPVLFAVYPAPLARAGAFGFLAAMAFGLVPLARARSTPPAALLRQDLSGRLTLGVETLGAALCAAGLIGLVLLTAPTPLVAEVMVGGLVAAFAILWLLGRAAAAAAGRLRGGLRGPVGFGVANLAGRASAARTASPAIGFGVALLSAVVLIQSSLLNEVRTTAPASAPSLILTQIPPESAGAVDAAARSALGPLKPAIYQRFAFLTGRIAGAKGLTAEALKVDPGHRWAFDQDLAMTALDGAPSGDQPTAGAWWPATYAGPPLVMLDQEIARAAGLAVGDTLTLQVLGRTLTARISGLRRIEWSGFGVNLPVVLNSGSLKGAALRDIAIIRGERRGEDRLLQVLGRLFPGVNAISVRDQLNQVSQVFEQLAWAVRGAAAVAALAGLLVLIGAVAASAQARTREAALLKVLGSTRPQILAAYAVEYGVVGVIAGAAGLLLGGAAAYPVVVFVFKAAWSVDWAGLGLILAAVAGVGGAAGALGATLALSRRPGPALRAE